MYIRDETIKGIVNMIEVDKLLAEKNSKYQEIKVYSSKKFGKVLVIDGVTQTTEKDEFFYHEMLAHPAMFTHPNPRVVLIIGGGDGGLLKEVLKHKSVEKVILIDLDEEVINISMKFLPEISDKAFDDKRVKVIIGDGKKFIDETGEKFDIILSDLTDPIGEVRHLYTKEFYESLKKKLQGVFCTYAESPFESMECFARMIATLKSVFRNVDITISPIPSFFISLSFAVCSNQYSANISESEIEKRMKERGVTGLKFYSPGMHKAVFTLPPYVEQILSADAQISTLANPVRFE